MINQMPLKSTFIDSVMDRSNTVAPYAHRLYSRARWAHQRKQLRARLTGQNRRLFTLEEAEAQATVVQRYSVGTRTVALDQIRGTMSNADGFDIDFYPVQERTENRWLQVATAFLRGASLPPVELIQVGDHYFVVDGHHRLSVARTLKHTHVDAVITVWDIV
jgi:autotransporter translocation and assembly factor TamB